MKEKACNRNFYWSNGFTLDSRDKKFKIQFGGRILLDGAYMDADQEIDDAFLAAGDPLGRG